MMLFPCHFFCSLVNRKRETKRERKNFLSNAMESTMRLAPSKTISRPAEAAACVRRLVEDDVSIFLRQEKQTPIAAAAAG